MKIFTSEHTFDHPWKTVVQAAWRKYPNPLNPNVKAIDVVNRQVDGNGVLHSHRLMTTQWCLPGWVNSFLGGNPEIHVNERSEVDPSKQEMILKSTNITLGGYITIDETLEYVQHPTQPNCTLLKQEAVIGIRSIPMSGYLEGVVKGNCSSNAQKGRQGMEWVIDKIKEETRLLSKSAEEQLQSLSKSAEEQIQNISRSAEEQLQSISKSAEEQMQNISRMSEEQIDSLKNSITNTRNLVGNCDKFLEHAFSSCDNYG